MRETGNNLPPSSNTGAENTSRDGLKACIDWVSATFKTVTDVDEIVENILLLNPEHFRETGKGKYGYQKTRRMGHISILYDGHPEMGVHLEMTGQGCREYENLGVVDWQTFFRVVLACEGNFTRVDTAIDDHRGYWTTSGVERKIRSGEVVSKFKTAREIRKTRLEDGKEIGRTFYFGSERSRLQIRMYDKRLQLIGEGRDPEALPAVWRRVELETRDERAQAIAGLIVNDVPVGAIVAGVLKHYVRFCMKGTDRNKSRWKTATFWEKFLRDAKPLRLATAKPDVSVEKKIKWVKRQVAPSLATIVMAMDGDMSLIREIINEGHKRLKQRDLEMIEEYKQKTSASDRGVHMATSV